MGKATEEARRETGSGTTLWHVIAAPIVWSVHFLVCYIWAAIHCEKAGRDALLVPAQTGIYVVTGVALVLIGLNTVRFWRTYQRSVTDGDFDFEANTVEERHRFLGHASIMLSVLSAVAVIYVAIPALLLSTCR